jgi:hypothetical protein
MKYPSIAQLLKEGHGKPLRRLQSVASQSHMEDELNSFLNHYPPPLTDYLDFARVRRPLGTVDSYKLIQFFTYPITVSKEMKTLSLSSLVAAVM